MSTPAAPNSISMHDVIEEANKTSWVSPAYPTPALTKGDPLMFITNKVNTNRKTGRTLDSDEIGPAWFYDWSTWKAPKIEFMYFHQFDFKSGIRAAVKLTHGDPWRTLVRFLIRADHPTTGQTVASGLVRFAGEFNAGSANVNTKYSWIYPDPPMSPLNAQAAVGNQAWTAILAFGDYTVGNIDPVSGAVPDPTDGTEKPEAIFSFVDETLAADNTTVYYLQVELYDGRQNDVLGANPVTAVYDVNGNEIISPSGLEAGPVLNCVDQDPLYDPGEALFDAENGDGGIILFNELGGFTLEDIGNDSFTVNVDNAYTYYLMGAELNYWIYVTDQTGQIIDGNPPPWFPDSSTLPADHPYNNMGSDDYTTFELRKWVRFTGDEFKVMGLSANQTYYVYLMAYRQDDIGRYPQGSNGSAVPISAPEHPNMNAQSRTFYYTSQQMANDRLLTLSIDAATMYTLELHLDWTDPNGVDGDYYRIRYRLKGTETWTVNQGTWKIQSPYWGTATTNRDGNVWQPSDEGGENPIGAFQEYGEIWEVQISSQDQDGPLNDSPWTESFEVVNEP